MTVPQNELPKQTRPGESVLSPGFVILSDRRESKDLPRDDLHSTTNVRRSFGALRLLRMTCGKNGTNSPKPYIQIHTVLRNGHSRSLRYHLSPIQIVYINSTKCSCILQAIGV